MPVTSEKLLNGPIDRREWLLLAFCLVFGGLAMTSSLRLAVRHWRAGQRLTDSVAPHPRSLLLVGLCLGIPGFCLSAMMGVLLPELAPLWGLCEATVLAANFQRLPFLFCSLVGGRVRLHLRLQSEDLEPFSFWKCKFLCFRYNTKPVKPDSRHVRWMRWLILQMCIIQPLLAFVQVVAGWEDSLHATWIRGPQTHLHAVVTACRLTSMIVGLGACRGLQDLICAMNAKMKLENLQNITSYCQAYVMGMNLIPTMLGLLLPSHLLWGRRELSNGEVLTLQERDEITRAVFVLVGALICTAKAFKAFPVSEAHYPELFTVDATTVKAMLRGVKFCPFCGSDHLQSEERELEGQTVACSSCGAQRIPARLSEYSSRHIV